MTRIIMLSRLDHVEQANQRRLKADQARQTILLTQVLKQSELSLVRLPLLEEPITPMDRMRTRYMRHEREKRKRKARQLTVTLLLTLAGRGKK
jgi:hypothetical protein